MACIPMEYTTKQICYSLNNFKVHIVPRIYDDYISSQNFYGSEKFECSYSRNLIYIQENLCKLDFQKISRYRESLALALMTFSKFGVDDITQFRPTNHWFCPGSVHGILFFNLPRMFSFLFFRTTGLLASW